MPMTTKTFREEFGSVFENPIMERIKTKKDSWAQLIIDIAAYFAIKYDVDRAYFSKAFTPHDFSHHIVNVIEIASQILEVHIDKFDPEDLFCFVLACILHDIGMIYYPAENRFYHSFVAANMISEDIFDSDNTSNGIYEKIKQYAETNKPALSTPQLLTDLKNLVQDQLDTRAITTTQKQKIAVMVLGHSDLKFKEETINTLAPDLYNVWDFGSFLNINVLAAFLRWADELDLSQSRCNGIIRAELPPDSQPFWDKLNLISKVRITPGRIILTVDGKAYKTNKNEALQLIDEILNKVNKERTTCNELFSTCDKTEFSFPEVALSNNQKAIISEFDAFKKKINIEYAPQPSNDNGQVSVESSREKLDIDKLKEAIKECIAERHLLKEGHYCLHTKKELGKDEAFCIRNPLDCNGLLSRHDLLDDIAHELLLQIFEENENSMDDYMLIGIANSGALIAAHMASISGIPFVSIVPNNKCTKYTPPEKDLNSIIKLNPSKKHILVIGVNYTGIAIADACERIMNVEWVVGLINRDMTTNPQGTIQALETKGIKHFFIIHGYKIDKCQYAGNIDDCPYGIICSQHPFD